MAQQNPQVNGNVTNLSIIESTVLLGDNNDHVQMSRVAGGASVAGCNAEDEQEILRIYKKLDVRHKSEFMLHCFAFEDEYDERTK